MQITLAGQLVTLLPERAMFLHATQSLLIADAHLGKAAAFRKLGVPVPSGTTAHNLGVISRLVTRLHAREIIFLGDLFHNDVALNPQSSDVIAQWCAWRTQFAQLHVTLIIGNHDAKALKRHALPTACDILLVDDFEVRGNISLWHELTPDTLESSIEYALYGHIHPGVLLFGKARQSARAPCFWLGKNSGALPAFGAFTGLHLITPQAGDEVYVAADAKVMKLPTQASLT